MKPVTREQWTAALRSGDYVQGRKGMLYDSRTKTFCCLGVLCDLAGAKRLEFGVDSDYGTHGGMKFEGQQNLQYLYIVPELASMVGLTTDDQRELARMNDSLNTKNTFADIADYIDKLPFA